MDRPQDFSRSTIRGNRVIGRLERFDQPRLRADTPPVDGFVEAVEAMIRRRRLSDATARNVRDNLVHGRFGAWREAHGFRRLEDLNGAQVVTFFEAMARTPEHPEGFWSPATIRKVRQQLGWLRSWAVEELGRDPLDDRALREYRAPQDVRRIDDEEPFTQDEVGRLLAAARPGRDRTIVELLATTGMRPSEVVALTVLSVRLDRRPPRIEVTQGRRVGRTKTPAGIRSVPLEFGGRSAVRALRAYIDGDRKAHDDGGSAALFLAERRLHDGRYGPLTQSGLTTMFDRLGVSTGIHCNPYRFRHSVCSWAADAGFPEHALMTVMGWADRAMLDRYYRRRPERVLELAARLRF